MILELTKKECKLVIDALNFASIKCKEVAIANKNNELQDSYCNELQDKSNKLKDIANRL